jgi:hypothetical protein
MTIHDKYSQNIYGNLTVITFLLGLQLQYTKSCEWDRKARESHYSL